MRIAAALGIFVAFVTAVCPLQICFDDRGTPAHSTPGRHSHDGHGHEHEDGSCVDVPKETGGPWVVVHLDLPGVRWAEPGAGPRTPPSSAPLGAPRAEPLRVLLR